METEKKVGSRKKFIIACLGVIGLSGSAKLLLEKKKRGTMKMLTEDGRLVEVDADRAKKTGKKVSNKDIHSWIKNNSTP